MVKNPPANAGGMGSVPDPGRSHMQGPIKHTHHNYRACALRPVVAEREVTAMRSVQTSGNTSSPFSWWEKLKLPNLPSPQKKFLIQCALCYNLQVSFQCLWAKSWNAVGNVNDYENANCVLRGCREPTPVFLPGESHGQRILEGLWGHKELDTTYNWTTKHN